MKNLNISTVVLALSISFSFDAIAGYMSTSQYEFLRQDLETNYKFVKKACSLLTSGNAKDICYAQAKGSKSITKAELEEYYKPSVMNRYATRIASSDADYLVATVKCDGKSANGRAICVNDAKEVKAQQMVDAMVEVKTPKPDAQ